MGNIGCTSLRRTNKREEKKDPHLDASLRASACGRILIAAPVKSTQSDCQDGVQLTPTTGFLLFSIIIMEGCLSSRATFQRSSAMVGLTKMLLEMGCKRPSLPRRGVLSASPAARSPAAKAVRPSQQPIRVHCRRVRRPMSASTFARGNSKCVASCLLCC